MSEMHSFDNDAPVVWADDLPHVWDGDKPHTWADEVVAEESIAMLDTDIRSDFREHPLA